LCLGGRQHAWVVTGWDSGNEYLSAYELFCPTCGRLVGRERQEQSWTWEPLPGE
jgi:hypothetical protein